MSENNCARCWARDCTGCPIDWGAITDGYGSDEYTVPTVIRERVVDGDSERYGDWADLRRSVVVNARNVRVAYAWAVASIQTDSDRLDELTAELDSFRYDELKEFLETTADAGTKWAHVLDFWNSDRPEDVVEAMNDGDVVRAQAILSGLKRDGKRESTYIRPTKANFITGLLGDDDSLCLDSRRHRVLTPLLREMLPGSRKHPVDSHGEYRSGTEGSATEIESWTQEWLQDRLTNTPEELRAITTEILDAIQYSTGVERMRISHILFNLGGPTTFHEPLQELLETE